LYRKGPALPPPAVHAYSRELKFKNLPKRTFSSWQSEDENQNRRISDSCPATPASGRSRRPPNRRRATILRSSRRACAARRRCCGTQLLLALIGSPGQTARKHSSGVIWPPKWKSPKVRRLRPESRSSGRSVPSLDSILRRANGSASRPIRRATIQPTSSFDGARHMTQRILAFGHRGALSMSIASAHITTNEPGRKPRRNRKVISETNHQPRKGRCERLLSGERRPSKRRWRE